MRNIPENYNQTNNFWDYNPQFTLIPPFRAMWKSDKSRGKVTTSNLMWAITLIHHPMSDLYGVSNKEESVSESLLGLKGSETESFWKDKQELVTSFLEIALTQAEKSLADWYAYMKKRDSFLKSTEYYFDKYKTDKAGNNVYSKTGMLIIEKGTADQLDKAWGASKSMWADYEKVRKELQDEEDLASSKTIKSSTATGEI